MQEHDALSKLAPDKTHAPAQNEPLIGQHIHCGERVLCSASDQIKALTRIFYLQSLKSLWLSFQGSKSLHEANSESHAN